MNTPKHTPGPWRRENLHPDPECRESIVYITAPGSDTMYNAIAVIYNVNSEERNANADILAASKATYEALKEFVRANRCGCGHGACIDCWRETMGEAAVAQAEGRAQS